MYNKLFTKILDSSIWLENNHVRLVWITFLAMMDQDGTVALSGIGNVASRTRITEDEAEEAIKILESPDPRNPGQEHDGQRIERVPGVGWIVLNSSKYRDIIRADEVRAKTRERVKRHRLKTSCNGVVTACNDLVTPSEAEAEATMPPSAERALGESLHGEKKKKSRGDPPNRRAFKKLWRERYQAVFGSPYLPQDGKDDAQADKLLALPGYTPESLMAVFEKAWVHKDNGKDKAFYCQHSVSIAKAVQFFNEINSEVGNLKATTTDFVPRKL